MCCGRRFYPYCPHLTSALHAVDLKMLSVCKFQQTGQTPRTLSASLPCVCFCSSRWHIAFELKGVFLQAGGMEENEIQQC